MQPDCGNRVRIVHATGITETAHADYKVLLLRVRKNAGWFNPFKHRANQMTN